MPLAHDIELRQALDTWIESWRKFQLHHPEEDLSWREQMYNDLITLLDSRKDLTQ
jgi:hypothetical protein